MSDIKPIPAFCVCFCSGVILAAYSKIPLPIFYICAFISLVSGALSVRTDLRFSIFVSMLAIFLGASVFKNSQILPSRHIAKFTPYKSVEVSLRGVIISDPVINKRRTTFIFNAKEIIGNRQNRVWGKVQVTVFSRNKFSYGQGLILTGKLYRPMSFIIGKRFRYKDYLKQQGIYSLFSVRSFQHLRNNQSNIVQALAFWLKHKTQQILRRHICGAPAAVLEAMILGERQGIPAYLNTAMMHVGTIHILVVSGFNVGIVAFIVLLFLKIIRIARKSRYIITILSVILYCLMTGSSVPVVRATIMATVILLGSILRREANIYDSLSISALIILILSPGQLFNIGFQLSFMSVLAIICLYPKIYDLFPQRLRKIKIANCIVQVFSVSASAWMGTLGLVAYYFNIFSIVGVFANMVIAPFASLITICGLSLALISIIAAPLAYLFAACAELQALILIKTNLFFADIPGAYFRIPQLNLICVLGYYFIIILLVFCFSNDIITLPTNKK